jgi:chromosome segregation ATPase
MSIFGRAARLIGLVRASRYQLVVDQLRRTEARCEEVKGELAEARTILRQRKEKLEELTGTLKETTSALRQSQKQARLADRLNAENVHLRKGLDSLKQRLSTAERDLAAARDHLMAVEVKLDILEGAARVLDRRTRTELKVESGTGAPV